MITQYKLAEIFTNLEVTGISFDSKKVKAGDAFFAIRGAQSDGNKFISEAIKAGAKLIISDVTGEIDANFSKDNQAKIFYVENARASLGEAASIFYPDLPEYLLAVTGTNGKTSVVSYCQQILHLLSKNSCSIGTLGVQCSISLNNLISVNNGLTTADVLNFRQILHLLAHQDVNYVAFEASSQGLDQERINGIKVRAAAFTSFSHEHLDYHKTMDNYLKSKLKLFTNNLLPGGFAIINSEISELNFIKKFLSNYKLDIITIGKWGNLKINNIEQSIHSQKIKFSFNCQKYAFDTQIVGSFQASNLLIAATLVYKIGFSFAEIVDILPKIVAAKGRLERVTSSDYPFHIFVDYAHTPDSMAKSLRELKKIKTASGKLHIVFGCGGDRDKSKRLIMGKIAARLADRVTVTDDNPRTEEASRIRQEIILGCGYDSKCDNIIEIPERKEAIIKAIKCLNKGDILLIAGKGHEDYQIIGKTKLPFNDFMVAKLAIREIMEDK